MLDNLKAGKSFYDIKRKADDKVWQELHPETRPANRQNTRGGRDCKTRSIRPRMDYLLTKMLGNSSV